MPARALSDPFLYQTIERAAHWLPAQGPITVFVHHNTLHALESLPFEQAVRRGGQLFGSRAYLPLERYRLEQERGGIRPEDVDAALLDSLGEHAELFVGLLLRLNLAAARFICTPLSGPNSWTGCVEQRPKQFRRALCLQRVVPYPPMGARTADL